MAAQILVRDVHKSFGETKALNGATLVAAGGEVHAVVGENGSGKSTLAKILSGVLHADAGEVTIGDTTPHSPIEARRLGIATIFQEVLVADDASVTANLFVGADSTWGLPAGMRERRHTVADIMQRLTGTSIDPDTAAGQFPLSVKQWIVIARALLTKPKYLILDESSAALDLDATVRLHHEIRRLREEGVCIIIVTHRIAELVRITDRATILRDGQTVATLPKEEITEKNLMALMTPLARQATALKTASTQARAQLGPALLKASGLQLAQDTRPFDFELRKGQIVGVTGLDGHGQDQFVKCLAGIAAAVSGVPVIGDEHGKLSPVTSLADADRLGISYVSGDRKRDGIFPDMSIYENLALGLYRRHLTAGWIAQTPIAAAFKAEMRRLSVRYGSPSNKITSLSGGNQQKILIGRAFASKPRVIVLNDPARGVDLGTKRELYEELRKFSAAGGAVVYLSSEIEEFVGFADRVDVFRDNHLSWSLAGQDIDEQPILAAMFGHRPTETHLFDVAEEVGA